MHSEREKSRDQLSFTANYTQKLHAGPQNLSLKVKPKL